VTGKIVMPLQAVLSGGYCVFTVFCCPDVCSVPTWTCLQGRQVHYTHMQQWRHYMT